MDWTQCLESCRDPRPRPCRPPGLKKSDGPRIGCPIAMLAYRRALSPRLTRTLQDIKQRLRSNMFCAGGSRVRNSKAEDHPKLSTIKLCSDSTKRAQSWKIPSGKRSHNYGKSQFLVGHVPVRYVSLPKGKHHVSSSVASVALTPRLCTESADQLG